MIYGKPTHYLVDANVVLYALNNDERWGKACDRAVNMLPIATTKRVFKEIRRHCPYYMKLYTVRDIEPAVAELHANRVKQPTEADLSLIQAAIDHPEIKGIISYDSDLKAVAATGIISKRSSHMNSVFIVGTADEVLRKENK